MSKAQELFGPRLRELDPVRLFEDAYGFAPMGWQESYLWDTRNCIVLKGRQVGASTCAGLLAVRIARHYSRSLCAIVSPSQKQSTEVKVKAKGALERLGERLMLDSASVVGLENGSRIMSLPGSPKSVRGWTADFLVIDEAAFLDPDTFLAARATVATGGRLIVQSTPAGPFGHFYDLWTSRDTDSWGKYTVSSEEVSTIDSGWLAGEKATMTAENYAQEYLGQFTTPGLGLVDPSRLNELVAAEKTSVWDKLR